MADIDANKDGSGATSPATELPPVPPANGIPETGATINGTAGQNGDIDAGPSTAPVVDVNSEPANDGPSMAVLSRRSSNSTDSLNTRPKPSLKGITRELMIVRHKRIIQSEWHMLTTWQKQSLVQQLQHNTGPTDKLCQRCESLDLDFDNFVIPSKKWPSFHGEYSMGVFTDIYERSERSSCPLCKLLIRSLSGKIDPQVDGNPSCYLAWTPDGMKQVSDDSINYRTVHLTRRLQIVWRKTLAEGLFRKSSDKSYIVLMGPETRLDAKQSLKEDKMEDWARPKPTLFLARLLTTLTTLVQDSSDLANKWLKVCLSNHGDQCAAVSGLKSRARDELVQNPSFVVVDVDPTAMCLVSLAQFSELPQYVALSYTWGKETKENKRFRCHNGNAKELQQKEGLQFVMRGLPMGIQDAINLTRKLNIRYLWVDSLCIIQENDFSWANNLAVMDVIYGNATLTICAADEDSANVGLKAIRPRSESKYTRHADQYWIPYQKMGNEAIPASESANRAGDGSMIKLMLSQPSESYIARSRWHHRCWTLQERLLSPRCLIFVEGRMYFQCRCTTMSEDIYSDDTEAVAGWSVELHGSPALILKKVKTNPIDVYKDLVEMYTVRDLSREYDILNAFKGITNLITDSLGQKCEMIYGLPNTHFDWGLL